MAAVIVQHKEDLRHRASNALDPAIRVQDHMKQWAGHGLEDKKRAVELGHLHQIWHNKQKPFDRTMQFWSRAIPVYASYKFCQLRTQFLKKEDQQKIWEEQHEWAAGKVYTLCSELGGFFLKVAQLIGKPDLAPDAWVRKLVTLCDAAPATSFPMVKCVLEGEYGIAMEDLFEEFHPIPIGSASVAQVHRARIKGATNDVAVKVQHPGVEELMMTDIRNLKAFAAFLQRFDLKFDTASVIEELEEQVGLEFDFQREASSMDRIAESLSRRKPPPVIVPRPIPGLVTRRALIMQFINGTPILRLGDEMAKRGINPKGTTARLAKRNILKSLAEAYGHMILKDGFFQADPHPGNILIDSKGKVALLDYGQVKELPVQLRLRYAELVLALNTGDSHKISHCLEKLGIVLGKSSDTDLEHVVRMASSMFDTKLPPGSSKASPFEQESSLKQVPVNSFPKDLFFVMRTILILRGMSVGMQIPFSCVEAWKDLAKEALSESLQTQDGTRPKKELRRELIWEKRKRSRPLTILRKDQ